MSTYTEAHKRYFEKNKDKIRERRREYLKEYNRKWYETHKAYKDAKTAVAKKERNKKKLRESIYNQIDPSSPEASTIPIVRPDERFPGNPRTLKKV